MTEPFETPDRLSSATSRVDLDSSSSAAPPTTSVSDDTAVALANEAASRKSSPTSVFVGGATVMTGREPRPVLFQDWGLIDYAASLQRQTDLVDLVHQELSKETIVFCSHSPVVTLGRATREGDIYAWRGPTIEVSRGGRATYHGPHQLVAYPILNLNHRGRDLHRYMRQLEEVIIRTLAEFGVKAEGHTLQKAEGADAVEATGVWIGSRKIASIGIGVRKWISFHGLALNIDDDPQAFQGMKPCGFQASTMTSLQEILGEAVDHARVRDVMKKNFASVLDESRGDG